MLEEVPVKPINENLYDVTYVDIAVADSSDSDKSGDDDDDSFWRTRASRQPSHIGQTRLVCWARVPSSSLLHAATSEREARHWRVIGHRATLSPRASSPQSQDKTSQRFNSVENM
ncbi:unnamed protein product [Hapterophycus canaliculatus]